MRILLAVLALLVVSGLVMSCDDFASQNGCKDFLNEPCAGGTGGGGGSTSAGGGTGGSGGGCKSPADCPAGDKCQVAVCTADGVCTLNAKDCNGLECDPQTGLCQNDGQGCTTVGDCTSGNCVDDVCCDSPCDGTCYSCNLPGSEGTCAAKAVGEADPACDLLAGCGATPGYCRCNDGVKNGDETDVDCGGSCGKTCGTGSTCMAADGSDCVSGSCVDGYCCNDIEGCNGDCNACNLPDHPGICSSLATGTADALCTGMQVCGAAGTCASVLGQNCTKDTNCASNNCKGSPQKTCKACPLAAGGADCSPGDTCVNGTCYTPAAEGKPCLLNEGCTSQHCVDGVCCASACDGLCMACQGNYTGTADGTCAPILKGFDPHGECPEADPSQPGPWPSGTCSGADMGNVSSCGSL